MSLTENIWTLTATVIIFFILLTDPKNASSSNPTGNQLGAIFSGVNEKQNSVRPFIWFTITCFYTLSLLISYY